MEEKTQEAEVPGAHGGLNETLAQASCFCFLHLYRRSLPFPSPVNLSSAGTPEIKVLAHL